jgi:predicted lipid-binding transport protein (Tim44 family)
MNGISRRFKCFSTAIVACAFLMSSEMPLFASPPQQSNTAGQKQDDSLPDAPQAQSTQTPSSQQPATVPSGVAGAKAPNVKGAPVAQPAGAAIAPVRQRGHRSLLIKLGLLAGAGAAVGSVVALSEKSPARTPGTSAATHP